MVAILDHELAKYSALAVMLLAILFGFFKGRAVDSACGLSRAWTHVPLLALAIASLGPSALATMLYLAYKTGALQPPASGFQFSSYIRTLPAEFAMINWPCVALYVACRLRRHGGRAAMWFSIVAMSLPNVLLFALAPTMLSTAFDSGQGIGVIVAIVIFPLIAMISPIALSNVVDASSGIGIVLSTLTAPIPILGFLGWLMGTPFGSAARASRNGIGRRSA